MKFNKKSSTVKNSSEIPSEKSIITEHLKSGTNIKTLHVEVKKSTHKTSYINAEFADINTHKGVIEGGDIHIKQLKGGKVIANTISVDFMENGTIEANYIHVKRLGSKNSLTATDVIEIESVEGIKNTFNINPIFDMEKFGVLSALYEKIMFYKKEFVSTTKILEKKRLEVEDLLLNAQLSRAKMKMIRESGAIPDAALIVKVREFDILSRDYQKLINMSESLKAHTDIAVEEFRAHMGWSGFSRHERVICGSSWRENNKIIFTLPKYNLSYNPLKGEDANEIYLWYNSELLLDAKGEFEIKINKKSQHDSSH
jgi:hypothetical protein